MSALVADDPVAPPADAAVRLTVVPRSGRRSVVERDPGHDRRHQLAAVAGWLLIVVGWSIALGESAPHQLVAAGTVVAASLVLCASATALWVAHNRRIHRRKGPRTGLPTARIEYATDWVGRPVTTEWSFVQQAREVVVVAGGEWKAVWPSRPSSDPGQTG